MKARNASRMASPAKIKAAVKVASAGSISSSPERTIMTESAATTSANSARRVDHTAKRDFGSSPNVGRRAISGPRGCVSWAEG